MTKINTIGLVVLLFILSSCGQSPQQILSEEIARFYPYYNRAVVLFTDAKDIISDIATLANVSREEIMEIIAKIESGEVDAAEGALQIKRILTESGAFDQEAYQKLQDIADKFIVLMTEVETEVRLLKERSTERWEKVKDRIEEILGGIRKLAELFKLIKGSVEI